MKKIKPNGKKPQSRHNIPPAGNKNTNGNAQQIPDVLLDNQDLMQMFNYCKRSLQYLRSSGILPYIKMKGRVFY